jgi:hypothetical protein
MTASEQWLAARGHDGKERRLEVDAEQKRRRHAVGAVGGVTHGK